MGATFGTGVGTRIMVAGDHFTVSASGGRRTRFRGAWYCTLVGISAVRVALGFVNAMEPYIDGRLMSGKDAKGVASPKGIPELKIKPELFDDKNRSWVCIQVRVDADGKMPKEKDIKPDDLKIVQSPSARGSGNELVGQFPVAMIRMAKEGALTVRQIAYFDLQHATRKPEKGKRQHFFW